MIFLTKFNRFFFLTLEVISISRSITKIQTDAYQGFIQTKCSILWKKFKPLGITGLWLVQRIQRDQAHDFRAISLKAVIWCYFKDHYFVYLVTCFNVQKTHYFSNTVHYCSSSMLRLSRMLRFLQSPSFRQAQSALIGQLAQCIVIGRTPQARIRNVTPLSIIASFQLSN